MMTRRLIILTAGALAFQSAAQTPSPNGRKAEWLQLRGDAAMSGRSPGIGHMVDGPHALGWRYDIAAWESYFSVDAHLRRGPVISITTDASPWGLGAIIFHRSDFLCR